MRETSSALLVLATCFIRLSFSAETDKPILTGKTIPNAHSHPKGSYSLMTEGFSNTSLRNLWFQTWPYMVYPFYFLTSLTMQPPLGSKLGGSLCYRIKRYNLCSSCKPYINRCASIYIHMPIYLYICAADQDKQTQFNRLVGVADRLYSETHNEEAATDIMRAAFLICPYCKNASSSHRGHFSERVFEFEEFTDRRYMSEYIVPAIIGEKPRNALWVGVQVINQVFTFRMNSGIPRSAKIFCLRSKVSKDQSL